MLTFVEVFQVFFPLCQLSLSPTLLSKAGIYIYLLTLMLQAECYLVAEWLNIEKRYKEIQSKYSKSFKVVCQMQSSGSVQTYF